jgi:hypothetical protein
LDVDAEFPTPPAPPFATTVVELNVVSFPLTVVVVVPAAAAPTATLYELPMVSVTRDSTNCPPAPPPAADGLPVAPPPAPPPPHRRTRACRTLATHAVVPDVYVTTGIAYDSIV